MSIRSLSVKHMIIVFAVLLVASRLSAQQLTIPDIHSGIQYNNDGKMMFIRYGDTLMLTEPDTKYVLDKLRCRPSSTDSGLEFDFGIPDFEGTIYYGLINPP